MRTFFQGPKDTTRTASAYSQIKSRDQEAFIYAKEREKPFFSPATIQPKLSIGAADDVYEKEADAMADKVMSMPQQRVQRACAACEQEEHESVRKSGFLQKAGTGKHLATDHFTSKLLSTKGGGEPMPDDTTRYMSHAFGTDLSMVRIHQGSDAVQLNRDLNARAFTHGKDIYFNQGEYDTRSSAGKYLLSHELTHVVQQSSAKSTSAIQRFPPVPIVIRPTISVVVTVVDDRTETSIPWYNPARYTGPISSTLRGDVVMTDVTSMVDNVIAFLNGRKMHRLNVLDHGNANGVEIGDVWLRSRSDVDRHAGELRRLRPHFESNAIVHMQNCRSGQNQDLICALAEAFGVTVFAGTGLHNPIYNFNLGDYVSCSPSGVFNPDAGRPATPSSPMVEVDDMSA